MTRWNDRGRVPYMVEDAFRISSQLIAGSRAN